MLAVTASAQKRYNLGECRDMALAHNARIKMANNDVLSAMQGKKLASASFFPCIVGRRRWNESQRLHDKNGYGASVYGDA